MPILTKIGELSRQDLLSGVYTVGLVLFVAALPLANSDLFYFFYPKLYPARLILVCLIAVSVVLFFKEIVRRREIRFIFETVRQDNFLKILLILFLVRAVSIANSLNYRASFLLLSFFASMVVLYLILKWLAARHFLFLERLYFLHIAVIIFVAGYGLFQAVLVPFHKILPGVLFGGTFLRVPSTFYDANHLPAYLLTGLPFLLVSAWTCSEKYLSRFLILLTGLLAIVVFLSFSRSGIAGFILSFLIIFLACLKYRYWQKAAQLLSVMAILGFFVFLSGRTQYSLTSRLFSSFSYTEKSTLAHVALLYGELKLFLEKPLLGVGYGSFSEHFRRSQLGAEHAIVDPATYVRIPPHSLWLEALSETGLIGFSLYLALILMIGESLLAALRRAASKKRRLYLLALGAGFVGLNFSSFFYSYNLEFFWFYLIFCYLYAHHSLTSTAPAPPSPEPPEKLPWTSLLLAGTFLLLTAFFFFFKLGEGYLDNETAGRAAYLAKWVMRRWEMGWPNFWQLYFGNTPHLNQTPFYYWLGAVMVFLYYVTTFTARFWSAFFGLASVCLTAVITARRFGRTAGFLGGLAMTALPFYLVISRSGMPATVMLALVLTLAFLASFVERAPHFWLFLGLVQGIFFLTEQKLAVLSFAALMLYGLLTTIVRPRLKDHRPGRRLWWLSFPAVSLGLFFLWYQVMSQKFGPDFTAALSFLPEAGTWNFLLLAFYPLAAVGTSLLVLRLTRGQISVKGWGVILFGFLALSSINLFWFSLDTKESGRKRTDIIRLIEQRYAMEPNGIIPILLESRQHSYVFHYYSDVDLDWRESLSGLEAYFLSNADRTFFAILPGEDLRLLRRQIPGLNLGTQVLAAADEFVLVKKW